MTNNKLETTAKEAEKQCVFVLGMHRSGTSALSGVFHQLGAGISKNSIQGSTHNLKGYFESPGIGEINDEILSSLNSAWDDLSLINSNWFSSPEAADFQKKAENIIDQEFDVTSLFIMKDPRICRLVPFWIKTLNDLSITPIIVHTHRNPLEVSASLNFRDHLQPTVALLLWLRHILDAEISTRGMLRYFTSFKNLLQDSDKQIIQMQDMLGFAFPKTPETASDEIGTFLTKDLKNHNEAYDKVVKNLDLLEWIRTTFMIMENWSNTGEDEKDYPELDLIKADLDTITPTFIELIEYDKEEVQQKSNDKNIKKELTTILNQAQELESEQDRIKFLEDSLQTRFHELATLPDILLNKERKRQDITIAQLNTAHKDTTSRLMGEIEHKHAEIVALHENYTETISHLTDKHNSIMKSTSWKITKPVRIILDLIRSFSKK